MLTRSISALALAVAALLPMAGCIGESESDADEYVVYGILDTEIFLFNQHFVGQPSGGQDAVVPCLYGGTAHFVGSTSADASYATVDFVISMAECASSGEGYDLTFTGDLRWQGSYASTGYKALTTQSDLVQVVGDAAGFEGPVDEACALAVTDRGETGQASVTDGEWCGRDVYY